jgi:acyl-CoA dehydrogenase
LTPVYSIICFPQARSSFCITSKVVDRCLQLHGAGGASQVFKLASMYAHQRTLRLADGPNEARRDKVGRLEIAEYN